MQTTKRLSTRKQFGAISTEYVIVLVLIAVAGILGFMFLGQQLRNHSKNIVDKVGGQVTTKTKSTGVVTTELTSDKNDMTGSASGSAESQVTAIP